MDDDAVRAVCARLGAGEIGPAEAAEALRPAYAQARAAKAARDPDDEDAATDWLPFDGLAYAQVMGVISTADYGAMCDALIAAHHG